MKFPAGATKPSLGEPVTSQSLLEKWAHRANNFARNKPLQGHLQIYGTLIFLKQMFPQKNISVSYLKKR